MRSRLILALMYVSFISLGLPDSLLGASWPVMQPDLDVPHGFAGIASMVIAGGTIIASFFSGPLIQRWGTGSLTRISVTMTALALLGFSLAPSFAWLLLMAIPLGLGGGAVDAALNHVVATHYEAHHMNWLHCFWGVGAMTGPLIMTRFIADGGEWRGGYLAVSFIQALLVAVLFASIPLWRQMEKGATSPSVEEAGRQRDPQGPGEGPGDREAITGFRKLLRLPGVYPLLITFLLYTGIEGTVGLWASSFLSRARGFGAAEAAFGVSVFYGSLTVGRMISGFVSMRMNDAWLIRTSLFTIVAGAGMTLLTSSVFLSTSGLAVIGLGCAPIYPALLHQTPRRFGATWAPVLMGIQMAVAYTGSTFLPPLFGLLTAGGRLWLLPMIVLLYALVMLACTEVTNRNRLLLDGDDAVGS